MKSSILDKFGNPFEVMKSSSTPNLDPNFWNISSGSDLSTDNILNMPDVYQVWVHACISVISRNISQVDRVIKHVNSEEIIQGSNVIKLLKRPNRLMDMVSFFYFIVSYLLLPSKKNNYGSGGQCFIIPWNGLTDEPAWLNKGEVPDELMVLSEEFFTPWEERSDRGLLIPKGWTFELPGISKSKINFDFGQIIRIFIPNPHNLLKGMSDYASVAALIDMDAKADIFNTNTLANFGRLDGVVSTDHPNLLKSDLDLMKSQWYEQYSGPKQKKVAFLYGGMKYQQFSSSPSDLGYIDQGKWVMERVITAYGLNNIALGRYESINYATIREGRKILWYDRFIPLDRLITSALQYQWIQYVNNGIEVLTSEYAKVPALQADMQERTTIASMMCEKMDFPPVVASRIMNIPLTQEDIEKYPHLSEAPKKEPISNQNPLMNLSKTVDKSFDRKSYSNDYIKKTLEPPERQYRDALDRYFIQQRNQILDNIDKYAKSSTEYKAVNVWEFFPDEVKENLVAIDLFKKASKLQAALEKKQVDHEMDHTIDWSADGTRIDYWVSIRAQYVKDINTATFRIARNAINAVVKQGTEEGITVGEMRKRIKDAVHDVYQVRQGKTIEPNGLFDLGGMSSSKTIARTEMGNIASWTRADIFKQEGVKKIEWITAHDDHVRDSHKKLDGQTTVFGHSFDGSELRYPRDPNGSAEDVINCRCSYIAVIEDGE